ncbi:MAG: ATP-dependent helicase HrpB [Chitinivibrionales bacterium]|nr:ATP-dependent helicase HrpB [Chitinivibrionales bacterium]MBD3357185.1 ATP-dependent helicase HrpB [Chitinivibrionales bacterium]
MPAQRAVLTPALRTDRFVLYFDAFLVSVLWSLHAMPLLPIHELEPAILDHLTSHNRLVIQAPTGSGKSTQVPQILAASESVTGTIVVLQPRRIAARMLAERVARERDTGIGVEVGFRMRFENRTSDKTRIVFMTEGTLFRQLLGDRMLENVGALVFNEFHERNLYSDILLSLCRKLQQNSRPDLKLIVMSATLDTEPVAKFYAPCPVLTTGGRMYPVSIDYLERPVDTKRGGLWISAARELERILPGIPDGDILVFMPGAFEIHKTIQALEQNPGFADFALFPLHGSLPSAQQHQAVEHTPEKRKIIVSTNIAQTSLTIEGVTAVIDGGFARIARYDPFRGIDTLSIERISISAADQRAGRAGRIRPGVCLRLWTREEHRSRPRHDTSEVKRVDLAETILGLYAAGVEDPESFEWFEPPESKSLLRAQLLLRDLGSLDHAGRLTELGRTQSRFPLHPRYSRMLIEGRRQGCLVRAALAAALTHERSILLRSHGGAVRDQRDYHIPASPSSDLVYLINAYRYVRERGFDRDICSKLGIHRNTAAQVEKAFLQLTTAASRAGMVLEEPIESEKSLALCVLAGFSDHLAKRLSMGTSACEIVHGGRGEIAPESGVRKSELFVSCDIREIEKSRGGMQVKLSMNTAIEREWLTELFDDDVAHERRVYFDKKTGKVICERNTTFRDLVLSTDTREVPSDEEAAAVLTCEIMKGTIALPTWDHAVDQLIARINTAARRCPEWGIGVVDDTAKELILHQFCLGMHTRKQLRDKAIAPFIKQWLSPERLETLNKHLPERLQLPTGRKTKLRYSPDGSPPVVGIMIQQLYDMKEHPVLAHGKVPVLVEVLAPNQRPVQVTGDIRGFFKDHYPELKRRLSRRYPKHEWR